MPGYGTSVKVTIEQIYVTLVNRCDARISTHAVPPPLAIGCPCGLYLAVGLDSLWKAILQFFGPRANRSCC
eukprot:jgi/Botrbrau1/12802/Bobra.117_1s0018.1